MLVQLYPSRLTRGQAAHLSLLGSPVRISVSLGNQLLQWTMSGFFKISSHEDSSLFSSPTSCYLILSSHVILRHIHGQERVRFGSPRLYNHISYRRGGRSVVCTMCYSTGLCALANIIQGIRGRELFIAILRSRTQDSTDKMSPGVVLVAAVPRLTDLLTWERRHVHVSTMDISRSQCIGVVPPFLP